MTPRTRPAIPARLSSVWHSPAHDVTSTAGAAATGAETDTGVALTATPSLAAHAAHAPNHGKASASARLTPDTTTRPASITIVLFRNKYHPRMTYHKAAP